MSRRRSSGARAAVVEHDLQVVAVEQVDAVVGGVLRQRVDLREDVVVVDLQAGAGRVRRADRAVPWVVPSLARPSAVVRPAFECVSVNAVLRGPGRDVKVTAAFEAEPVTPTSVPIVAFNSARVDTSPAPVPKVMTWLAPPLTATVNVWPEEPILSSRLVRVVGGGGQARSWLSARR